MSGKPADIVSQLGTALNPMSAPFSQPAAPVINKAGQEVVNKVGPKKPAPVPQAPVPQAPGPKVQPAVVPTYDQAAIDAQKKKQAAMAAVSGGRASTILTGNQGVDRLG